MSQEGETIITVFCQATLAAAAQIIHDRPTLPRPDSGKVAEALKAQVLAHYQELLAEMKEANEAHMGEPILRAQVNASATTWAIAALKAIGFLGEGPSPRVDN